VFVFYDKNFFRHVGSRRPQTVERNRKDCVTTSHTNMLPIVHDLFTRSSLPFAILKF
jgi:hypothetical protein